jgi:hypothetical protein
MMELRFNITFQELLTIVKALSPSQRERLKQELEEEPPIQEKNNQFIEFLLAGPVYSKDEIKKIELNRKSISEWRKKN